MQCMPCMHGEYAPAKENKHFIRKRVIQTLKSSVEKMQAEVG